MNIEFICCRRQKNMNYEVQPMNKQEHEKIKYKVKKNVNKISDIIGRFDQMAHCHVSKTFPTISYGLGNW